MMSRYDMRLFITVSGEDWSAIIKASKSTYTVYTRASLSFGRMAVKLSNQRVVFNQTQQPQY